MILPKRLAILVTLRDLLEGITEVKGLPADLKGRVFMGRNIEGAERDGRMLSVLDAPRPDIADFAGEEKIMRSDRWTMLVMGVTPVDMLNPSFEAHWLVAAVEMQLSKVIAEDSKRGVPLYPEHHLLGGLITSLEIAPPVVRAPDDKVSASSFFFLPIRVGVAVDISDPFVDVPITL